MRRGVFVTLVRDSRDPRQAKYASVGNPDNRSGTGRHRVGFKRPKVSPAETGGAVWCLVGAPLALPLWPRHQARRQVGREGGESRC